MSDRQRPEAIAEMLYGPGYSEIWADSPTSSDVRQWLNEHRKTWTSRPLANGLPINEVTKWAREQGLKRLDWDFIPKQKIWFRDPEVAMLWDLTCSQKTTEILVDKEPK